MRQKRVWRAEIILLSADGAGTVEIMRQTGRSKTCVWRWQERFAATGFEGLLRDDAEAMSRFDVKLPSPAARMGVAIGRVAPLQGSPRNDRSARHSRHSAASTK
jgi:Homeodomain-like domain